MLYESRARFLNEGGKVSLDDNRIKIENADAVTIYQVAATNFVNYKDVSANQAVRVLQYLGKLEGIRYYDVRAHSVKDFQRYFNRVKLDLTSTESSYLPTDKRMESIFPG